MMFFTFLLQGIYSADTFAKALNYCYNSNPKSDVKLALLCEVRISCLCCYPFLLDFLNWTLLSLNYPLSQNCLSPRQKSKQSAKHYSDKVENANSVDLIRQLIKSRHKSP